MLLPAVLAALLGINCITAFLFWLDKARAVAGARRIPEADLLALAAFGGTPGAFLARHLFRHKTRKQPFSAQLYGIAIVQIGLSIGFSVPLP